MQQPFYSVVGVSFEACKIMLVARTLPPFFIVNAASLRVLSLGRESLRCLGMRQMLSLTMISLGTIEDFSLCAESAICKMFTGWLESPNSQGSAASMHMHLL